MILDFYETNKLIGDKLQSGEPFSCLRIDNTAGYVLHCLYKTDPVAPSTEFCSDQIMLHIGVVPAKTEYYLNTIMPKTYDVMKECDILGFVDVSHAIQNDQQFLSPFQTKPKFFTESILVMDPAGLLGYSKYGAVENPWTQYLAGKKVLVISSHANSIKYQWNRMHAIWNENRDKIVPFDLVDAISTPYHPDLDDRQYSDCINFMEKVQRTKNIIDLYDYDVLLTGITTQSPFYAEHAKRRGKVGIQVGGSIQLFFGVVGNRWLGNSYYSSWRNMFNENWIFPLKIDEPQKKHLIDTETGYAYWK